MGVCRILGLIGSSSCLVFLVYWIAKEGMPNEAIEWWAFISLALVGFNLVPGSKSDESLVSLWLEAKKVEFRKRIDGEK